jgi:D-alanyl-D-alanine carboxypeptidase
MLRIRTGARDGLRGGVFGFATLAAVLTLPGNPAGAAPYADIVVDANSGDVLHATNPDARRHPASLTKIMTLYLLFEQLEAGKLKLDSQLKVSEEAAGQSPTKLGLKPGSTVQVEDAIKGIITRSANDASVVVAEAIAGDEASFARLMTRKALALGMTRTIYRNASGLPDDEQVTTARDQSILGRAIQERFPRYYKYFSTRSFTFRGQWISNHNRLLGHVEGVDGIKTGYIRSSGFNLVTSVHRGNRYIVAVVMGGASAGSRDAKMRELISSKIAQASTKRTTSMFADAGEAKTETKAVAKVESRPEPKPEPKAAAKVEAKAEPRYAVASAASAPVRFHPSSRAEPTAAPAPAQPQVAAGSTEPIRPVLVKTVTVRASTQAAPTAQAAQAAPTAQAAKTASLAPVHISLQPAAEEAPKPAEPVRAAEPAKSAAPIPQTALAPIPVATAKPEPRPAPPPAEPAAKRSEPAPTAAPAAPAARPGMAPARTAAAEPAKSAAPIPQTALAPIPVATAKPEPRPAPPAGEPAAKR